MEFLRVIFLALALSLDGLGVGVAYGLKGMVAPVKARLLVATISTCVVAAAFFLGSALRLILPIGFCNILGRIILLLVGIWFLFQAWIEKKENGAAEENLPLATFSFKSLGIVILVLRHPSSADFDHSGAISLWEAVFLGLALAMDAFGAGLGAAIGRSWPLYTPLMVGLVKYLFLTGGLYIGGFWSIDRFEPVLSYLPGMILCFLGLTGI